MVDETGAEPYEADVATVGRTIAAGDPNLASGSNEIDARGLPTGGRRLVQRAKGYAATIVSGEVVHRNDLPTDALSGRLVRGPQAVGGP